MKSILPGFTTVTKGSHARPRISISRNRAGGISARLTSQALDAIGNPSRIRVHVDVAGRRFAITPSDDSDRNSLLIGAMSGSFSISSAFRALGGEPKFPLGLAAEVRDGALIFTLED